MTPQPPRATVLLGLYRAATRLAVPLLWPRIRARLEAQGVPKHRQREKLGRASLPRPAGPLIWFHAASVGESLSVLGLITRMGADLPRAQFLITSGTATSAALIAARIPPRTRHQFAPLDAPPLLRRFLDHWRPDALICVESELWPVMLQATRARAIPAALVNARLSDRSVAAWRKRPRTARALLDAFALLLAQSPKTLQDLKDMGADPGRCQLGGNLKAAASAPPVSPDLVAATRDALMGRRFWLASSTHPGEEAVALDAHAALRRDRPDLALILVPRHPDRGDQIAALIAGRGLRFTRRSTSQGDPGPAPDAAVLLADTLGETGSWYALAAQAGAPVFLGATLADKGGHNPLEPALAGCAILAGPYRANAAPAYAGLAAAGGLVDVADTATLALGVARWLDDPTAQARAASAAQAHVTALNTAVQADLDHAAQALIAALSLADA